MNNTYYVTLGINYKTASCDRNNRCQLLQQQKCERYRYMNNFFYFKKTMEM